MRLIRVAFYQQESIRKGVHVYNIEDVCKSTCNISDGVICMLQTVPRVRMGLAAWHLDAAFYWQPLRPGRNVVV